jgi:glycerophosphoryl diester phosphodiesterase
MIISFNAETIAACKKTFPEIKAHWLTSFKRSNGIGPWTPAAKQIIDTVKNTGADGVGLKGERTVIDNSFIESLASGGVNDFHVWTIDSPADAQYFRELGASGITTNRPTYIRQTLEGGN